MHRCLTPHPFNLYYRDTVPEQGFPVAERLTKRGMNLPSSVLLTDEEVEFICVRLVEILKSEDWAM